MTPPDAYSHALPLPAARPPGPRRHPQVDPRVSERLHARQRRVAAIRKRIATIAAVVFVALWAVIFVQLVSGHDPALNRSTAASTATTVSSSASTASTGASSSNTASSSDAGSSSNTASSSNNASSGTTSPVTTSQS